MTTVRARPIFSQVTLARLAYDEPVNTQDTDTGITLQFRFEAHAEGMLRLTGGRLRDRVIAVGCDPDDLNLVATLMLDGLKAQFT